MTRHSADWKNVIPLSVKKKTPYLCTSIGPAIQSQELLSSPWCGALRAYLPKALLLQRNVLSQTAVWCKVVLHCIGLCDVSVFYRYNYVNSMHVQFYKLLEATHFQRRPVSRNPHSGTLLSKNGTKKQATYTWCQTTSWQCASPAKWKACTIVQWPLWWLSAPSKHTTCWRYVALGAPSQGKGPLSHWMEQEDAYPRVFFGEAPLPQHRSGGVCPAGFQSRYDFRLREGLLWARERERGRRREREKGIDRQQDREGGQQ